jgi:hypothetical protein
MLLKDISDQISAIRIRRAKHSDETRDCRSDEWRVEEGEKYCTGVEEEEGFLDCAARRARLRRERENRAAPLGMTIEERGGDERTADNCD